MINSNNYGNGNASSSLVPRWTTGQVVVTTLFIVAVLIGLWLLVRFNVVIFILFISIVISTAISPGVDLLYRLKVPRALGVVLIYLLLFAAIIGFILLVVPLILNQVASIASSLPKYYDAAYNLLGNSPSYLLRRLSLQLPPSLSLTTPPPAGTPEENSLQQVGVVMRYGNLFVRGLLLAIALFLLGFYWTLDGERTMRSLLLLLPLARRESIREIITEIQSRLGYYIRGQVLMCLSIATMALILYLIIGVPYALSLALFAGLMEAVPILGPTLGAIPPAMVLLGSGEPSKLIWLVVGTMIIQNAEGYLLVPRIMGSSVGVSPLVTLLAIAAFTSLMGIPGALLAIPIAAVLQVILDHVLIKADPLDASPIEGRDSVSVLRMEIQDLASDVRKHVREKDGNIGGPVDQAEEAIESIALELDKLLTQDTQPSTTTQGNALQGNGSQ